MKTLISNFSSHLQEAIEIGNSANLNISNKTINNILISGLGGSGIGGTIVSQLLENESGIPISVNKTYSIPNYVDEQSLVIISSYSGNTEETLSAMKQAISQGAEVACITSGGEVLEIAQNNDFNHIIIPGGMPPRACFGFSFTQLFYILHHYKIIGDSFKAQIKAGIIMLEKYEEEIKDEALSLAQSILNKTPVIYTSASYEGVGIRLRQQINENSKLLCWHQVFPEMNHNELVGWKGGDENLAVLILRNNSDYSRTQKRMEICKEIFSKYTNTILEVFSKGDSEIERTLYLIHLGDWISWFLSEKNDVDAMEIEVINYLKSELSKI